MKQHAPSFWKSVLQCKCPRCRKGNLFTFANHFKFSGMLAMPESCAVCQQKFEIEPGFYLGALWLSYPLVLLTELATLLTCYLVLQLSLVASFAVAAIILLLLLPITMRLARSLLIHLFVSYL